MENIEKEFITIEETKYIYQDNLLLIANQLEVSQNDILEHIKMLYGTNNNLINSSAANLFFNL